MTGGSWAVGTGLAGWEVSPNGACEGSPGHRPGDSRSDPGGGNGVEGAMESDLSV